MRGYKVFYIGTDEIYDTEMNVMKSNNQYLTVENLKKYTNYSIWVLAYTKVGDGVKTKHLFCRTYEDGNFLYCIFVVANINCCPLNLWESFIFHCFIVPSVPQDIKAIPASNTKVIVSWLPPLHMNGEIVSYTLI